MRNLLELGNLYAKESSWKDFALVKLCLCAMGIIIGTKITPKYKKTVIGISAVVFVATYIPLMVRVFKIMGCGSTDITISQEG